MGQVVLSVSEANPGEKWRTLFQRFWPSYREWFLKEGFIPRPSYLISKKKLKQFMPELVPLYERLVELAGGGDLAARCLSLYRPTPYLTGCSQVVWQGDSPVLIRNYDYYPSRWEGVILRTQWTGRRVLVMSDCLWGALDGINENGLVVSLAFGGRSISGDGFGVPLILRYILEMCTSVEEAKKVLQSVPSHMAYNVTVLDKTGDYTTAYLSPDRDVTFSQKLSITNHQAQIEWPEYAKKTKSVEREDYLERQRNLSPSLNRAQIFSLFRIPPLLMSDYKTGHGTLYSAMYSPKNCDVTYRWSERSLTQSIRNFVETAFQVEFVTDASISDV